MKFSELIKKRKKRVYISFGIYLFLIAIIVVESCLDSSLSGVRSNFLARISAFFINLFNGPQVVETIEPNALGNINDSTYLGKGSDDIPNIALGTTSLITIEVNYPKKKHTDDVFDKTYTIEHVLGEKNDYNTVISTSMKDTTLSLYLRIVANKMSSNLYQINVNFQNDIKYSYQFHIVNLPAPKENEYEAKIDKNSIKIGESLTIDTKLVNGERTDWYLKRYLDISKIERSSSNSSVAKIDEYGVIHGISEGNATITYGKYNFDISVSDESINIPSTNTMSLRIEEGSNDEPCLLDYDYVFADGEDADSYSSLIYPSFSDTSLEDQSVSYILSDPLKAKIVPYKYDENGYPQYFDELNRNCVRICGYREKGNVELTCISNADKSISQTISLEVEEATATEMKVNVEDFQLLLGGQKTITATFSPKNTHNTRINVSSSDSEAFNISNNDSTSVTVVANKIGTYKLTISSLSNPSLSKEINVTIEAKQAINDNNFASFAAFMRKFAGHMGLFLITSMVGFYFFYYFFENSKKKFLLAIIFTLGVGLLVAGLSEFIQYFVPSRSGLIRDVGIDFIGVTIGVIISIGIYYLIKLIKYLIEKSKKQNDKE
ncbi:MAG: VanZ family protein [Bacilli bacterium]|nr:VanZ family protein [Bacilli bacterium]